MKIPERPTAQTEYTLKEHKAIEDAPIFILKPLSVGNFDKSANLTTSGQIMSGYRFACHHSIKGWKNLEPEFTDDKAVELIDRLDALWIAELGGQAMEISTVSEKEKN